ncbi:hypothetical protein [Methanothermococcus okinawensis]|uniref:Uncharacterized protein n=1 Tax=Methanothermococcus okinawensis (strain DSM 14208 / JCM 11175 / IH1) TaxID=647113 RepID=F8AJR0_METOI|nr:hypothetical protein [Methanothermococcus okinawensis]AEH07258.1 hypothetical protein Metok_1290 [Methanothermococcus okinawensis IH1]
MNKTCLICTLGNRDIQFKKEYENELKDILGNILDKNKDHDSNDLIIAKGNFLEYSKKILDNYDRVKDYIVLAIMQTCLDYIKEQLNGTVEKIILVPTNQQNEENVSPNHKAGDTFIEAEIIKRFLEENGFKGKVEIKEARFDASNLDRWFKHILTIIDNNHDIFDKIIFEVSGGVPTSKEAIRLASLFKEKIEVVEVKGKIDNKNMSSFEKQIIKEKVKDLIKNYNYVGALSFKEYYTDDKKILNLIEHLNYRLNFDFDNALKSYNEERLEKLDNENNTIERLKYLILELLDNMEIELRNRNYANFLARVYRLEEAMGQYFVLKWFEKTNTKISYKLSKDAPSSGLIDAKDVGVDNLNKKIESYLKYLANGIKNNKYNNNYHHSGVRKLVNFIEENCKNINNNTINYKININTPLYYKLIKYLYGNYSDEIRVYEKIQKMYKKDYNNLRHTTIVAHGFEGINKGRINDMLKSNGIENCDIDRYFNAIKSEFLKIAIKDNNNGKEENIFDKLNNEIINLL